MKIRSRAACISAAVAAFVCGGSAQARDLIWDYSPGDGVPHDGTGQWDLASPNWVDSAAPGANVTWVGGDSAIFGGGTSTVGADPNPPYNVNLVVDTTVQNLTLADVAGGRFYSVSGFQPGGGMSVITLNGNLLKSGNDGSLNFFTDTILSAGNHTITMRDTPNDVVEFIYNGVISGSGGLTVDNDIYEAWGTVGLNQNNTYTGLTNINKGRIIVTSGGALGSDAVGSGTTIGSIGTLSIGGAGTTLTGGLNISEPITITRDTYTGGEFERYRAAIIYANTGTAYTHAITGPLVVDSTDARIQVNSNTLTISSNVTSTTGGTLTLDGDFNGFVNLTGNNTGIATGGTRIAGGVQVNVANHDNLGGASAPIKFEGSATLHPIASNGWMPNFGSHTINNDTFSGGLNIDEGHAFTVDVPLGTATTGGSIGKRGKGTLNLNSLIQLRGGQTFWDAGVVNVNNSVTLHSLHLRSPVVNIGTGGSVTTTTGFNAIGQDSTGTDGQPDKAVVNITGTGQLIQTNAADFNISDNANTEGTLNLHDNGVLTTPHHIFVGKSAGAKGTINQFGGTINVNRAGDFGLVLGSRDGLGTYNLSGGTLNGTGQFYVGQGQGASNPVFGTGVFTMTGGTVNQNSLFAIGREGGVGTMEMSAGSFNKGPGNTSIGERQRSTGTMTLRGSASFISTGGEFFVGNNEGSGGANTNGTLNVQDSASLSVNNWFVVGRFTAGGTVNLTGGTITKTGGGNTEFDVDGGLPSTVNISGTGPNAGKYFANSGEIRVATGGGANATLNVTQSGLIQSTGNFMIGRNGGTGNATVKDNGSLIVTSGELFVGQGGGGTGVLTIQNSGSVSVNNWFAIGREGGNGTVNLQSGTLTKTGGGNTVIAAPVNSNAAVGLLTQTGGIFTNTTSDTWINEHANTGTWNFSGGTANLGRLDVGRAGGGTATLTLSGTAALNAGLVSIATFDNINSTINLNGGTLQATQIVSGGGGGPKNLNLNGGILKAGAGNGAWLTGGTTVNVKAGGAQLDSNSFDATITRPLLHDAALGATPDGGVTKSGDGTFTLAAANTYTGPTTVNAGTLALGVSMVGPSTVTINSGATLRVDAGGDKTLGTPSLAINGGRLDLTDNDLIVDYTGASVEGQIRQWVKDGRTPASTSGIFSTPGSPDDDVVLAVADNAAWGKSAFNGINIDTDTVVGKYTYFGDANLDGKVTGDDYVSVDANLGTGDSWLEGDFNMNGVTTGDDYVAIDANLGKGTPTPLAFAELKEEMVAAHVAMFGEEYLVLLAQAEAEGFGASVVPEPATFGLIGVGAVALLGRRRRRSAISA